MSEKGSLIFTGFISIIFIALGILGIYQKITLSKNKRTMHSLEGIVVDYISKPSNHCRTMYSPVYEYEWNGIKKRLYSNLYKNGKRYAIGRHVHIFVDPRTEDVICLEDENAANLLFLVFGLFGLAAFAAVLAHIAGILS